MSGGRFDYADSRLKDEIFGWSDKPRNVFEDREISELVWDVLNLIHDYDWYASGDTSESAYLEKKAAFKKKWLQTPPEERIKRIVAEAVGDLRQELYKNFNIREV